MIIVELPQHRIVGTPHGGDYLSCPLCDSWSETFLNDDDESTKYSITWC